jgi:hypothetical protein
MRMRMRRQNLSDAFAVDWDGGEEGGAGGQREKGRKEIFWLGYLIMYLYSFGYLMQVSPGSSMLGCCSVHDVREGSWHQEDVNCLSASLVMLSVASCKLLEGVGYDSSL